MDGAGPNRRVFAGAALAATLAGPVQAATPAPPTPGLDYAFDITVTLAAPVDFGLFAEGRRRFVPITGGRIDGPRLTGEVLTGGGDWQTIGSDGVTDIHAHYALRANDGTTIDIDNPGVRVASPEVIARLTAGEDVDPGLYYFRSTPRFTVRPGPHDWLRKSVFVGYGVRHPNSVALKIFRVL